MTTVALRPSDRVLAAIDDLVGEGRYASLTEVVRRALDVLLAAHHEAEVSGAWSPNTAATSALTEEEPW